MSSSAPESSRSPHCPVAFDPDDASTLGGERVVSTTVGPFDRVVVARVVTFVSIAALVIGFGDGRTSAEVALLLVVVAAVQPLIAVVWRRDSSYRQAQVTSDLIAAMVCITIVPDYYWLCAVAVASLISDHAVTAPLRNFVPTAIFAVAGVGALGAANDIPQYERVTGLLLLLAAAGGATAWTRRASTIYARRDLLSAISAVGGLAYLVDLTDDHGVVDVVGDVEAVVGWTKEEWIAADHRTMVHPDDLEDFWLPVDEVRVGDLVDRTARVRHADGRWIWMRDMARVVNVGKKKYLRGFSIDVTAQQDGLDRVTTEASTDALTGLRNRRWLLGELDRRDGSTGHYLVLIDLNRFKDVNDTLGHDAGDALLRVVADRLVACLRPSDVIARLGGDEFAILIDRIPDPTMVAAAVDRIAWEIARPVELNGFALSTSISAGIAAAPDGDAAATTMLRHADIAMYAAKRSGRISVHFDDELEATSDERTALLRALPESLASGELVLHYQPIVEVATGETAGLEGLARWQHPRYGLLRPDRFLEVVLLSDWAGEFTRAMVQQAIGTARRLDDSGRPIPVAVNLPIRTVEDADFGRWFSAACADGGVRPDQLVFELAERDIHDNTSITAAIDRLASLGATISVDDFGAGHATFERLRWRNVDQLKLDRGVMDGVTTDARERTILRSVLELANDLGYAVVAEGVEREDQLDVLRRFDCRFAQGYLFGRPAPIDEVVARLDRERATTP